MYDCVRQINHLRKKGTKAVTGAVPFQKVHTVFVPKESSSTSKVHISTKKVHIST